MLTAVDLSPDAAALLARSLQRMRSDVITAGAVPWPVELDQLYSIAVRSARSGQLSARSGQSSRGSADGCDGELMDMGSAARRLGVSVRTLSRLRAAGDIPTVRVGGRKLIRRSDVDAYIEERTCDHRG